MATTKKSIVWSRGRAGCHLTGHSYTYQSNGALWCVIDPKPGMCLLYRWNGSFSIRDFAEVTSRQRDQRYSLSLPEDRRKWHKAITDRIIGILAAAERELAELDAPDDEPTGKVIPLSPSLQAAFGKLGKASAKYLKGEAQ